MELEQRIGKLEQEVEVLKSQIQTALLDIQEQILTNAYPTLRAENTAQPAHPAPAAASAAITPDAGTEAATVVPTIVGVKRVVIQPEGEPEVQEDEPPLPKVVAVRQAPAASPTANKPNSSARTPTQPAQPNRSVQSRSAASRSRTSTSNNGAARRQAQPSQYQEEPDEEQMQIWVDSNIETIGIPATMDLIRNYMADGQMSSETADALFRIVAQRARPPRGNGRPVVPAPQNPRNTQGAMGSSRSSSRNGARGYNGNGNGSRSGNGNGNAGGDRNTANMPRLRKAAATANGVSKKPAGGAGKASDGKTDNLLHGRRAQLFQPALEAVPDYVLQRTMVPSPAESGSAQNTNASVQASGATSATGTTGKGSLPADAALEPEEQSRKLVLKLIAGIQNAGAGIGKRKNNG